MRIAVGALFICAVAPMMGQSRGAVATSPDKGGQLQPSLLLPQGELNKEPQAGQITLLPLLKMTLPPGTESLRLGSAQIDPKMVVHPPLTSIGMQPPGVQVAQNLYPGLELMPIDHAKPKVEPIPTTFSNMKVEKIPTTWTQFTVSPIQSGKADTAAK